jgi:hypothetical protein
MTNNSEGSSFLRAPRLVSGPSQPSHPRAGDRMPRRMMRNLRPNAHEMPHRRFARVRCRLPKADSLKPAKSQITNQVPSLGGAWRGDEALREDAQLQCPIHNVASRALSASAIDAADGSHRHVSAIAVISDGAVAIGEPDMQTVTTIGVSISRSRSFRLTAPTQQASRWVCAFASVLRPATMEKAA